MLLLLVLGKGFNATFHDIARYCWYYLIHGCCGDVNILIFERFKEEVFSGKSMRVIKWKQALAVR